MRPVVLREDGKDIHAWLTGLEIMPIADDPAFLHAAHEAKKHTGMDEMRLATLWQAVHSSRHCGSGELIEVGCASGGSGLLIALAQQHAGIAQRLTLVDTFAGIVKSGPMSFISGRAW